MSVFREIALLLRADLRAEWRSRTALSGLLLYVVATVVIVYAALTRFSPMTWNALYWVLLFLGAISAVARGFAREQGRRQLYYYTLVSPTALLLAKTAYHFLLLLGIAGLNWLLLAYLGESPVERPGLFVATLLLGCLGLASAFTFLAAISAKAGNNSTLLAVLAFPLVIPLLLLLVRLGGYATGLLSAGDPGNDLLIVGAIDLLSLGTGIVLFGFVWRD